MAVLKRVAEEAPRPIPEINPDTPQWLRDIVAKLHAKEPADRFQSAREVAALLRLCVGRLGIPDLDRAVVERGRERPSSLVEGQGVDEVLRGKRE